MNKQLKHKRSIGDRLKDHCVNAMHSIKQISTAVLHHIEDDDEVDDLFNSNSEDASQDFVTVLKKESKNSTPISPKSVSLNKNKSVRSTDSTTATATTTAIATLNNTHSTKSTSLTPNSNSNSNSNSIDIQLSNDEQDLGLNGSLLWEQQRTKWLTPTIPKGDISKRKHSHNLGKLAEYNDDVYLGVYRNLVVIGKPLKRGLNMQDGFKVIYTGWESTKMFERVANGGVP
jgi:hypothetical protein